MPRHAIHLGAVWEPPTDGAAVWVRRFGRPGGVESGDRLLLVCEAVVTPEAWREATLNGHAIVWHAVDSVTLDCDVTPMIADRNVLSVPIAAGDSAIAVDTAARVTMPSAWGRLSLVIVSD